MDLKTDSGREIMWKLVDSADVIVENFRQGVADRLGFGYDAVSARRPSIVYASMNAYGYGGPMSGWPGWNSWRKPRTECRYGSVAVKANLESFTTQSTTMPPGSPRR